MMGSGKSTVGSLLAEKLGYMAFDTDSVIEQATGSSVVSIFESEGEEAFRDMETDVLKQLSPLTRTVICTGGGAVLRSVNWGCMTHGISVWLDVPVATLARRVDAQGADSRPLAAGGDEEGDRSGEGVEAIEKRLEALREERKKSYGQADIHLEVPGAAEPERVCELVLDEMEVRVREVLTKRNMAEIQHDSGGFGIGNINTVQDDSGNGSQPLL
uniref:Shikimate kinase n=1 Tax=Prasinoderma singulare TaxID=676789 RepID=A0A7S3BLX0_9VIRI